MFINKSGDGRNNICGEKVAAFRMERGLSQRQVADMLQLMGLVVDKNAIQRIEAGKRFVTDIELVYFSKLFEVSFEDLIGSI